MPSISVKEYLKRLVILYYLPEEILITIIIYTERLLNKKEIVISQYEIHRYLAILCVLAAKYHCDNYYSNAYYARMAGMNLEELNSLEAELLKLFEYKLEITEEEYSLYEVTLENMEEMRGNNSRFVKNEDIFVFF